MMMTMLIVVFSVLIVQVWSKSVTADTTSGRLLGTQTDGGVYPPDLLSYSPQVIHCSSGIFQRHRKILAKMSLE